MMLAKYSVFIATSLDGYIARQDGLIDWLLRANAYIPIPPEDLGFLLLLFAHQHPSKACNRAGYSSLSKGADAQKSICKITLLSLILAKESLT